MVIRGVHIVLWGGRPWTWRVSYLRRSQWGPFGELIVGPVGFTWAVDDYKREPAPCLICGEPTRFSVCSRCSE